MIILSLLSFVGGVVVGLRLGRNWGFRQLGAFELRDRPTRARIGGRRQAVLTGFEPAAFTLTG